MGTMLHLNAILSSPDFYPLSIDRKRQVMRFVRMSPETYRRSIFLDSRTQSCGPETYEIRLDDLFLAQGSVKERHRHVHYILHTTFCCSTLLARYFEEVPSCLVLKEPLLLTQLALQREEHEDWEDLFHLSVRLLTRPYADGDLVVIKAHEPCNALGVRLLENDPNATISFLITPLRQFLLAVLKSPERRAWVRTRIPSAAIAARCNVLADTDPDLLSDAEAAAHLWLVNRHLCEMLAIGQAATRVHVLDGDQLATSPRELVPRVAVACSMRANPAMVRALSEQPAYLTYSKDLNRSYDANARQSELQDLESQWGEEANEGIAWAAATGLEYGLEQLPFL